MKEETNSKLQEMYKREYIVEQYKGLSRYELIMRIRDLESQISVMAIATSPTEPSPTKNQAEPTNVAGVGSGG